MKRFGVNTPILVDERGQIIAGHGRVEAAKLLGLSHVPVLRLTHMTQDEVRAYVIADNKLAEQAGWDRDILVVELEALGELGFDVRILASNSVRSKSCSRIPTRPSVRPLVPRMRCRS